MYDLNAFGKFYLNWPYKRSHKRVFPNESSYIKAMKKKLLFEQ